MTPTPSRPHRTALIQYPTSQSYILDSLRVAFNQLPHWTLYTNRAQLEEKSPDLQWSDYDELDWDAAAQEDHLLNSYAIRKGLIRKNHLAHTVALYLSKQPSSCLSRTVPKTLFFNLSFPDELDELLQDELYDVAKSFAEDDERDDGNRKWWILKAALADKGNGIRLFSTQEALEEIFEEFEDESDEEEEEEEEDSGAGSRGYGAETRVNASQLREWVIQEYISSPLLIDPTPDSNTTGHKFHLRVYVVAVGGLTVYVHHPFLALFAPTEYQLPSPEETVDLASHLTNTCLQTAVLGEATPEVAVGTLQTMADQVILGGKHKGEKLGEERIRAIEKSVGETVAEVFKAAVSAGTSFQVLPNAFEIFGVDFLVDDEFQVSLLEINACPDFTQTGPSLQGIIDHLFASTVDTIVVPFFDRVDGVAAESTVEESLANLSVESTGLRQVLSMEVRKGW